MKYHVLSDGDPSVGIDSFHEIIEVSFRTDDLYEIEFYNDLEKDFIELLKNKYDNGTIIEVLTDYEYTQGGAE